MRKALNVRINEAYNDLVNDMNEVPCEGDECEVKEYEVSLDTLAAEDSLYKALDALRDDAKRQGRVASLDDTRRLIRTELENFLRSYDNLSYWDIMDDELDYMLVIGSKDEEVIDRIVDKLNKALAEQGATIE